MPRWSGDDRRIFEFLVAALSWRTVLHKRKNFRAAFAGFDYRRVAGFGSREVKRLLDDDGIITRERVRDHQ